MEGIKILCVAIFCYIGGGLMGLGSNPYQKAVDKALAECEAGLVSTNAPRNIKCAVEIRAISKAE